MSGQDKTDRTGLDQGSKNSLARHNRTDMSGHDRTDWTRLDWAGPVSIENNFAEMAFGTQNLPKSY